MDKKNKKYLKNNREVLGLVCEDEYESSENTIEFNRLSENKKAEYGISTTKCEDGTPFDLGPSGGAISPFTEVNAENQGVISEVPRKPDFCPDHK
jgi:hypothetical protein